MQTVFDSAALHRRDRVAAWEEVTAQALVTTRIKVFDQELFHAHLRSGTFGVAQITAMSYGELHSQRTPAMIRKSDPEQYQIAFTRSGCQGIEQARTRTRLGRGDLVFYDSSYPFDASVEAGGRSRWGSRALVLQFPKRMLPLASTKAARLLAVPLRGTEGTGLLLAQFLSTLADQPTGYTPPDAARLGNIAVDLSAAVLSQYLDDAASSPARSPQSVLFLRISSFIGRHLHDPHLAPAAIASAHQISLRYLHRIFQQHGTSVSTYIRSQRLDRCRRDLVDPGLRHLTIHVIARRWGFHRPSDFSRAFRAAVGVSPSEYRGLADRLGSAGITPHGPPTGS